MAKRNWKRVRATSVLNALKLCTDHALDVHNRSVERIADMMGLAGYWTLYKWLENGRMPTTMIRPFELACGCTFLTDFLGSSAHKLLIDIPAGSSKHRDIAELQRSFSYSVTYLLEFYEEGADPDKTLAALTDVLKGAAWHRENVTKMVTPELGLFEEAAG